MTQALHWYTVEGGSVLTVFVVVYSDTVLCVEIHNKVELWLCEGKSSEILSSSHLLL